MLKNNNVKFSLGKYKTAIKVDYCHRVIMGKGRSGPFDKAKTVVMSFICDRYSEVSVDVSIIGEDILLNLIAAVSLNRQNKRVLISCVGFDSADGQFSLIKDLCKKRIHCITPGVCNLISNLTGVEIDDTSSEGAIEALCNEINRLEVTSGRQMTFIASDFSIHPSQAVIIGGKKSFVIGCSTPVSRDALWDRPIFMINRIIFKGNNLTKLSKPFLLINSKNVILTSMTGCSKDTTNDIKALLIGGALAETHNLIRLSQKERIIDIVSAVCATSLIADKEAAANLTKLWENYKNEE